jgi:two-component system invasion response regulator UvrY
MKKISIMIVDDHSLIREAFSCMLMQQENFEVIATTGDSGQVIELAREKRPDILLLDINMGACSGFDIIKIVRKNSPLTKIIGLSMHTLPSYVKKMLRLGARGYLTKNSTAAEMAEAINQVHAGNTFICTEVKNILSDQAFSGEEDKADINVLSGREIEVVKFLKEGQSSKQIAGELKISCKTVEVHRHHILKKLKLKNTASVVSYLNTYAFDF